jgi:hypothetical protein
MIDLYCTDVFSSPHAEALFPRYKSNSKFLLREMAGNQKVKVKSPPPSLHHEGTEGMWK